MAKLAERIIGNKSETVVSIKELDDYYKVTNKTTGKSEYTPSGRTQLKKLILDNGTKLNDGFDWRRIRIEILISHY